MLKFLPTLLLALRFFQTEPPPDDLVVTLRDERGVGVAGVTVVVREVEGSAILATARTDAEGQAHVGALTAPIAHVLVRGQLPTGRPLSLTGADANGIRVFLGGGLVRLDLRVGNDGHVVIDPTMFVQEPAGAIASAVPIEPVEPMQTLPPAPTVAGWTRAQSAPIATVGPTREVTGTVVGLAEVELSPAAESRYEPLLLVLILLCLGALVVVMRVGRGKP
jgi:hypothetical protein